jgi:hypothetical protein
MWGEIDDMVFQLTLQMIMRSLTGIEFVIKMALFQEKRNLI